MWGVWIPVSPESVTKVPHDQTQGWGRSGVWVSDVQEAFRESPQPECPHVHGPPTDSSRGPEGEQPAAAAVHWPADHQSDWRSGPARPGQVTARGPGLLNGAEVWVLERFWTWCLIQTISPFHFNWSVLNSCTKLCSVLSYDFVGLCNTKLVKKHLRPFCCSNSF